ncbi:phosphatase 2C-like domain-containing protein [Tribonema minus]|uniref:Phosphatase 2C-like domain-containing protein n=1 Tax=Tribonema minus TaxID=303371 RepID=A0A835Z7B9_9STRA|nr:phosphatase 2C-like domain-containing protein [Tribonema minus]
MLGVTRAFGDISFKTYPPPAGGHLWGPNQHLIARPETTKVEVLPQDSFLILACDGIWDVMTSQQAVDFVQRRMLSHCDVQRASRELARKAVDLYSNDNCSCIVVCLNQLDRASAPPTVPPSPAMRAARSVNFF